MEKIKGGRLEGVKGEKLGRDKKGRSLEEIKGGKIGRDKRGEAWKR